MAVSTVLGELHHKVYEKTNGITFLMDEFPLLDAVPFVAGKKQGKSFNRAIASAYENGFTFGGDTGDDFTLNAAVASALIEAEVKAFTTILPMRLSNTAARSASNSETAYMEATKWKFKSGLNSFGSMTSAMLLYGQSPDGWGTITGTPATSGSDKVCTISDATWAPGLWLGRKGLKLDAYNSSATKINTNAVLVIVSVDLVNKKITVSGNATDLGNLASTHVLLPTDSYTKAFVGLDAISRGPTTLWGLTVASNLDVLQGTVTDIGGPCSLQHLIDAGMTAANRGATGKLTAVTSIKLFGNLVGAETSLRRFDGSYSKKKTTQGTETLEVISGGIVLDILPVPQCKEGEVIIFPSKETYRVGTTDITDKDPTGKAEWHQLEGSEAQQLKLTVEFAPFCERPNAVMKVKGITY